MKYKSLGKTDVEVSVICLGTMTYGSQNSQEDGFAQMDYALEHGINFFDTAEMYPAGATEKRGATEEIIGNWFEARGTRDKIILATKIAGPNPGLKPHFGGELPRHNKRHVKRAIEGSLKLLKTDYIDLYQLHWPDRNAPTFGHFNYVHQDDEDMTTIEETLEALNELVTAGHVRHIGLSNETPWGTMRFLQLAKENGWPRVVSIQNHYNLLDRSFEMGLGEIAHREKVDLLAYSPLAMGILSGKYLDGTAPKGSRFDIFPQFSRFESAEAKGAVRAYVELAKDNDLDPNDMANAYVNTRPFLASNIIGAVTVEQLEKNVKSADIELSEEVLAGIDAIHDQYRNVNRFRK